MSDNVDLKLNVDVAVRDEPLVATRKQWAALRQELESVAAAMKAITGGSANLGRVASGARKARNDAVAGEADTLAALRRRLSFEVRMGRQRDAERAKDARAAQREAAEADKRLRDSLSSSARLSAQRERAAKSEATAAAKAARDEAKAKGASIREAARIAERAAKDRARAEADAERQVRAEIRETARLRAREQREAERRQREHEKNMARATAGAGKVRDGAGRVGAYGAAAGAVMGYGATTAIRRGVSTRYEIDRAETALKTFNSVPDGKGGERALTGADIKKLRRGKNGLDAEAIKNGVSVAQALQVYNEAAKAGLQDPMEQSRTIMKAGAALELDPKGITQLFGTMGRNMGKDATPARLKSVANAIAVAAREDPTKANDIVEGMKRGQGLLAMSSGITEEDLAGFVSGGISAGIQPGKAGTWISSLGKSITEGGSKFIDPKKRKELNFAARHLGFGSAKDMASQFAGKDGKNVLYQVLGGLKNMTPQLRAQVAEALSGGQWNDEDLQAVNGLDGMRSTDAAIHDKRNANFLDTAAASKMSGWEGLWNQSKTIFSLFWESFGSGFDGILREINGFFLELHSRFDYDRVTQYVNDALDGLRTGLGFSSWREALQSIFPSDISGMGPQIREFFTGFGEGLRSIGSVIRSVAGFFAGGDGASNLGALAGKLLALSVAAVAIGPVIGVLGGLATMIAGIAGVARGLAGAGAGAAGGGLAGAGVWASIGGVIGVAFLAKVAEAFNVLKADDKKGLLGNVLEEFVPAPLRRWLDGSKTPATEGWVDPPAKDKPASQSPVEKLKDETAVQTDLLRQQLELQREALQLEKTKTLTDKAKGSSAPAVSGAIQDAARSTMSGSVGSSEPAGAPGAGGPLPGTGMRRRGILGGGGSASSNPANSVASAKMLDAIAGTESGQAGYDAVLGNGKYGTPNKPVSTMTLDEAFAFGRQIRARHGSSSALGRYQIVGSTMRAAQRALNIPGDAVFDPAMQDRMARWIARNQGLGAWQGLKRNPAAMAQAQAALAQGGAADAPVASAGGSGGGSGPPKVGGGSGRSQPYLSGQIDVEGAKYDYGSGGHRGANSIPAGTYPITPDAVGPWGRSHGAIGINGNRIWDSTLNRYREGIEFHAASSASKITAGCLGVAKEQYGRFRAHVMEVIRRNGQAYLTVDEAGRASITATADRLKDEAAKSQSIADEARKPPAALAPKPADAKDDLVDRHVDGAGTISNMPGRIDTSRVAPRGSVRNMSGRSMEGGGNQIQVNVNAANHSPEEMANAVQRRLQDTMNRRTHDYEGFA